jgi:hypothetical protein
MPAYYAHTKHTSLGRIRAVIEPSSLRPTIKVPFCLPALGPVPVVHVLTDLILGKPVTLLELTFELIAPAINYVEIVVS